MTAVMTYFCYFVLYSFVGWVCETIFCSIAAKKFINRGFLSGPFCPIYGTGAVLVILLFSRYHDDLLALFFLSIVVTSIVEYITSWLLETLFHLSLWDYSNKPFNLNGRICLRNSVLFGLMSVAMVEWIHPFVQRMLSNLPQTALILAVVLLSVYFIADLVLTARALVQINREAGHRQTELEGLAEIRNEILQRRQQERRQKFQHRRVLKAFPTMTSKKYPHAIEEMKALAYQKIHKNKK